MAVADLADWYERYYAPNNATVVVVGDVIPDEVFALAEEWFGALEPSEIEINNPAPEPRFESGRNKTVERAARVPSFIRGYYAPVISADSPDDWEPYALEVLAYVLDGGYNKWAAEDRDTSILPSAKPQPASYVLAADAEYLEARSGADYLYTHLENPGVIVWDTRSDGEFKGSDVRANRGGHIPGATHLNWTNLQTEVNGVKILKSRQEIVALLKSQGLTSDKEIVAHCQTGIRSAYATLVMLGLGYEQAKNYDGSWIEWANNPTLPIVNAEGKLESSIQLSKD